MFEFDKDFEYLRAKEMGVIMFIHSNRFKYLDFLIQIDNFPVISKLSSEILFAYLITKFKDISSNITFCEGNYYYRIPYKHTWIKINETVVDFTLCQFHWSNKAYIDLEKNYGNIDSIFPPGAFSVYRHLILKKVAFPLIDKTDNSYKYSEGVILDKENIDEKYFYLAKENINDFDKYLEEVLKLIKQKK